MNYLSHYSSPLGSITITSDGRTVTGLWFDGQRHFPTLSESEYSKADLPIFQQTHRWLDHYFRGGKDEALPPLNPHLTPFQQIVSDILLTIPYGHTTTYSNIAQLAATRMGRGHLSAQAVGSAVGHNPISILIPCHRVIGANGSITGYAGGIDRKRWLLNLENPQLFQTTL